MQETTLDMPVPRKLVPFLDSRARYKGLYGGRGSIKSHFLAERALENSICNPGYRVVCIREVQKSLEHSSKMLLEDKIKHYGLGQMFNVRDSWIEGPNDGLIIFQGMQNHTADSIKSLEGFDLALIEEAQRISQGSWDLLYPTIRKPNSEIWAAWNPAQPTDPVDKFFRGPESKGDPDILSIEMNWRDNPFFKQTAMYKDMLRDFRRDPDKYKHIWGGGYKINSEARVFNNWKIDDVKRPARGIMLYCGADWGFSVDPTVLIVTYIIGKTLYVWREAYAVGCEIKDTPTLFDNVTDKKEEIRVWPITADSARPETISHMKNHGYRRIRPSRKGPGSVEEGINFLKDYDIIVDPSCVNTIDELTMFSFKVDKQTALVTSVLEDKKNHVIDALRYAVEPLRGPKVRVA